MITVGELMVDPQATRRLAQWLRLKTEGMSDRQVAKLVRWRITRRQMRWFTYEEVARSAPKR